MLIASIVLFVVATLLGITVASALLNKAPTSKPVAITHGLVGVAGLVLLVIYLTQHSHRLLTWATGLLVVAALGGALLFVNDLRQKPGPLGLLLVHAVVAVAAMGLVVLVAVS